MTLLTAFIQGCMVAVTVYVGYRLVCDIVDYYREKREQRIRAKYNGRKLF